MSQGDITRQEMLDAILADKRRARVRVLVALAVLAVVGFVGFALWSAEKEEQRSAAAARAAYDASERASQLTARALGH